VRQRPNRLTRRTLVAAFVGLVFAAAAGIGLADITTDSVSQAVSTTSTGTQTANGRETESADDQEGDAAEQETEAAETENESSTSQQTTSLLQTTTAEGTTTATGSGQEKVVVCHHTGSVKHPFHTITVAAPAVPAHEAHGDEVGAACPTTTTTTAVTPSQTTTTSAHHTPKTKPHHISGHAKSHGHASGHGNSGQHGKGKGK
jgi:hypothetical protein